jgi:hypothetical protein
MSEPQIISTIVSAVVFSAWSIMALANIMLAAHLCARHVRVHDGRDYPKGFWPRIGMAVFWFIGAAIHAALILTRVAS